MRILLAGLAILLPAACGTAAKSASLASGPLRVHVDSTILQSLAERIGGADVAVSLPVPDGTDPADWQPDDADLAGYQAAELILQQGANYAEWAAWASLPPSRCVDTGAGFRDRLIREPGPRHQHGPEGALHDHGGTAAITWLDHGLLREQARAVRDALVVARPALAAHADPSLRVLDAELAQLDADMRAACSQLAGQAIIVSHPIYHYWQRAYALDVRAVHWEPETVPDQAALAELDALLEERRSTIFCWEYPPDPRSTALLAARGLRSIVVSPAGRAGAGEPLAVLRQNIAALRSLSADP